MHFSQNLGESAAYQRVQKVHYAMSTPDPTGQPKIFRRRTGYWTLFVKNAAVSLPTGIKKNLTYVISYDYRTNYSQIFIFLDDSDNTVQEPLNSWSKTKVRGAAFW